MDIRILHLVEGARQAIGTTVVIDVFRAMTVEAYLSRQGAGKIIPVGDVEKAFEWKKRDPGVLLCGERGGKMIEGFQFGNSPSQIEKADLMVDGTLLPETDSLLTLLNFESYDIYYCLVLHW